VFTQEEIDMIKNGSKHEVVLEVVENNQKNCFTFKSPNDLMKMINEVTHSGIQDFYRPKSKITKYSQLAGKQLAKKVSQYWDKRLTKAARSGKTCLITKKNFDCQDIYEILKLGVSQVCIDKNEIDGWVMFVSF
jgi:bisphosphoglycerate-dependent phosphoglycerate mutase